MGHLIVPVHGNPIRRPRVVAGGGGGGGSILDGAIITRAGPTATKPNIEFLGGAGGYNDTATNGAAFSRTNWQDLITFSVHPHSSNERTLNRPTSVLHDTRGTAEYKQTLFFDTGASGYSSAYTSMWRYWNHDALLSGSSLQNKMRRWTKAQTVVDGDGAILSNWAGVSTAYISNYHDLGGSQDVIFYDNSNGNTLDLTDGGQWIRDETWLVLNTSLGTANGYFRVKQSNLTGTTLVDNVTTNRIFNGTTDALTNYRYLTQQEYFGNATDGGFVQADNANAYAFTDDLYYSWLTSGSAFPARAELVNNAVYASSSIRRICEITNIVGTAWSVKLNGAFAAFGVTDLTGLYLALFDGAGTPTMVVV